jgi:alpha-mannosidase
MLNEIAAWKKKHPEVNVVFSGLHRLFDALRKEMTKKGGEDFFPIHRGELNFVLRGCYSSVAKLMFQYRKTEALVSSAEKTTAVINEVLERDTGFQSVRGSHGLKGRVTGELYDVWQSILFNSFHDILPGSSIERAFDEQIAWLGGAQHESQAIRFEALTALSHQIDTRVATPKGDMPSGVALLVWNAHPRPYAGPIELEASLDYRPIWKYHKKVDELPLKVTGPDGKPAVHQIIDAEHNSMVELAWRKRVVMPVELPAMGWNVIEMAWVEGHNPPSVEQPTTAPMPGVIDNGIYRVQARVGDKGIQITRNGRSIFNAGSEGLGAVTVEDPWGSWGGMAEEPESLDLSTVRHQWRISEVQNLESGPIRSKMWVKMDAGNSRLELTISVTRGRDAVDVSARVLWDERSARLKLVMPVGDEVEYDVPGGRVTRGATVKKLKSELRGGMNPDITTEDADAARRFALGGLEGELKPLGEVPGGRWVRVKGAGGATFGFASDALYNFDAKDGAFRATVCRASRYADDVHTNSSERPWQPAVDNGELKFNFLISPGDEKLPQLAEELEQPPVSILVPPHKGKWRRAGSLASLGPENIKLLALKPAEDGKGLILRVQETSGKATNPQLKIAGKTVKLSRVEANRIGTWRLTGKPGAMKAKATNIAEE